jgi:site-specific recombinase XerD
MVPGRPPAGAIDQQSSARAAPSIAGLRLRLRNERGGAFTSDAVNRLIKRIGERAGFAFPIHVHMHRHACGYALANAGQTPDASRIGSAIDRSSIRRATRN